MTSGYVFIAGHKGMVGSALMRLLQTNSKVKLLLASRDELDLFDAVAVSRFFAKYKPEQVYLAAAKVGGIYANNTYPAEFISENIQIQCNVINAAHQNNVRKLLFLGSSCIYPKLATQPIVETALMSGMLEATNEPYAVAKIAGIKMCESFNRQHGHDYRSVMPTNLYGVGDHFHQHNAHVIPAMMQRFHQAVKSGAKEVIIWGSGKQMREFLHVDDMASACVHIMNLNQDKFLAAVANPMCSHINIGTGIDLSIASLAQMIAKIVGFTGRLVFDTSKPDGAPRKLLDVSCLQRLGWAYSIGLQQGLTSTYEWFLTHQNSLRK